MCKINTHKSQEKDEKGVCAECGKKIGQGLGGHQRGRKCRLYQHQDEVEERGLEKVRCETHKRIIENKLGGEIERFAYRYQQGNSTTRSRLRYRDYADEELVKEAQRRYITQNQREDRHTDRYRVVNGDDGEYIIREEDGYERLTVQEVDETEEELDRKRVVYVRENRVYTITGWLVAKVFEQEGGSL